MWKAYREAGFPIISTWIDEAGENESADLTALWLRCIHEAKACACLIAYFEEGDALKGAFIEIGIALSMPRLVICAGDWPSMSFHHHPAVQMIPNINSAFATGMRAAAKFEELNRAKERGVKTPTILKPH